MGDDAIEGAHVETGQLAADLAAMGITLSPPCGDITFCNGWAIVGAIVLAVSGGIEVVPRNDLLRAQLTKLLAVASQVWLFGKPTLKRWRWDPDLGWVAKVGVRYPSPVSLLSLESNSWMSLSEGSKSLAADASRLPSAW